MNFLRDIIYLVLSCCFLPHWLLRLWKEPDFRTVVLQKVFWRRYVKASSSHSPPVWLHGASVGEISLLEPLVKRLVANADLNIIITAYTSEGHQVAKTLFSDDATVYYLPFDLSWTMAAFIRVVRPRLIVLSELELWPNLLDVARRRRIPVFVVNSRMNLTDYRSYQRVMFWLRKPLRAITWWGVQAESDAERIRSLIPERKEIVCVTGSMKYDSAQFNTVRKHSSEHSREAWGYAKDDLLLIAGSTHAPEEANLIELFKEVRRHCPSFHLILVPRKPQRAADIGQIADGMGVSHGLAFNEDSISRTPPVEALIIGAVGMLKQLWAIGDFAFVGGSLETDHGGQNMLEPAAVGLPTCFGPDIFNFEAIADDLLQCDAACMVQSRSELGQLLRRWIDNPEEARGIGQRARRFVQSRTGATDITYEQILNSIQEP